MVGLTVALTDISYGLFRIANDFLPSYFLIRRIAELERLSNTKCYLV
jgi:hypothetical protein